MIAFDHPLDLDDFYSLGKSIIIRMTPLFRQILSKQSHD